MNRRGALLVGGILLAVVSGAALYGKLLAPLPEPTPTAGPPTGAPRVVSAEGLVVPHRHASLGFRVGGRVAEVLVETGEDVRPGQVLARLEARDLEARVSQAAAGFIAAEAALDRALAGARAEEIAGARAALRGAHAALDKLAAGPTDDEVAVAEAQLELARVELALAEGAFDAVRFLPGAGATPQSVALQEASLAFASAQATYNLAVEGPRVEDLAIARAAVDRAQAELDLLLAGPTFEEIALLEAQRTQAEAALGEAEAALAEGSLLAPFSGTVAALHVEVGELVGPGQPVVELGDLSKFWVKTTDLHETSAPLVQIGALVEVVVDALPDKTFTGEVLRLAPLATESRGERVFQVTIDLERGAETGLRWGMTAFVDIDVP
ncbi:MAG: HlyD family secretion protein [Anaerolineae bacterium]